MELNPITRLSKDLAKASATLSRNEARYLVDTYYSMQEERKRADNQVRALKTSGEPHEVLSWLGDNSRDMEAQIKRALDYYSISDPVGEWARGIVGVGPVIAAGLLAHIDIEKAPTAGHIWRYAGLDPTREWLSRAAADAMVKEVREQYGYTDLTDVAHEVARRINVDELNFLRQCTVDREGASVPLTPTKIAATAARRPWNAALKVLVWKLGESFVKVSGKEDAFYGQLYKQRKAYEQAKNERHEYADQAANKLARYNIGKDTEAYKAYIQGQLPAAHIHQRAARYAVKIFLSHWHEVAYREHYGTEPPVPFALSHLNHAHRIAVAQR